MASVNKKRKKCKVCKLLYQPRSSFQTECSPKCAVVALRDEKRTPDRRKLVEKLKRQENAQMKREWKENDISTVRDQAQGIFNTFIRLRDKDEGCISCDTWNTGNQFHAGHYRTRGAASHLKFNEDNCHKQCAQCNGVKSGNIESYRPRLIEKIGLERVEALENNNEIHRWTIEEYRAVRDRYKQKIKDLKSVI